VPATVIEPVAVDVTDTAFGERVFMATPEIGLASVVDRPQLVPLPKRIVVLLATPLPVRA